MLRDCDKDYDEHAQIVQCGDTTSDRLARDRMKEQEPVLDRFLFVLKEALPEGAVVVSSEPYGATFCVVVDLRGGNEVVKTTRYIAQVQRAFPDAVHLRRGPHDVWHVPYQQKAREKSVWCMEVVKLLLLLVVLALVVYYGVEVWMDA